jgi:hypothetical protein
MRLTFTFVFGLVCCLTIGCSSEKDRTCAPAVLFPVNVDQKCLGEQETNDGLQACRLDTEKGDAFECVASPDGGLYVARRNTAASLESRDWRYGDSLSSDESDLCAELLMSFPPGPMCE